MQVWQYLRAHRLIFVLSLLYLGLSLSFIVGNGLFRCQSGVCGLWIGQWHLHDALWHISLAETAFRAFPFLHPEFAGALLTGYNYLLDLVVFALTKAGLSPFFIFFQLLPITIALLYIYLIIRYILTFKLTSAHAAALAFFLYFGSSLSYLATIYTSHSFYYSSMRGFPVVTSIQPGMIFLNLQFALSLCTILFAIILLKRSPSIPRALLLGVLVFVTTGLKFYGGAMLLGYLVLLLVFRAIQKRQLQAPLIPLLTTLAGFVLALAMFYFSGSSGNLGGTFAYVPFAITHLMIEDPLLFFNHSLTLARYYLSASPSLSPRLVAIEGYSIFLFLLLNFGTRLFALPWAFVAVLHKRLSQDQIALIVMVILATLMPVLFVQAGGWYNTMQFLYYGVFFASFLAAPALASLFASRRILPRIIAIIWIILTLPNNFEQLRYVWAPQNVIGNSELAGLTILAHSQLGVVYQSGPLKEVSYLPALTGHVAYFVDLDQLMVTHVDYVARANLLSHPAAVLADPIVKYVYLRLRDDNATLIRQALASRSDFHAIFANDQVEIYARLP